MINLAATRAAPIVDSSVKKPVASFLRQATFETTRLMTADRDKIEKVVRDTFAGLPDVKAAPVDCPACGGKHSWSKKDAVLEQTMRIRSRRYD